MARRFLSSVLAFAVAVLVASGCEEINIGDNNLGTETPDKPDEPQNPDKPSTFTPKEGQTYMFDGATVPKIHITVPLQQWNSLLACFDADPNTKQQVHCDVVYDKAGDVTSIKDCSIRLKGNTSRRRPEGTTGQMHSSTVTTDWHHCHFQVNFRKYNKDSQHELHGVRKVVLKWFKDDPCYVRELFCYDLFRRFGVWTGAYAAYCQLYLKVEGDEKETYFGVYEMVEPIDERFLKNRAECFDQTDGFLWKCRWGAGLNDANANMGPDLDDGKEYTYELKTRTEDFSVAKEQLCDFILKLNGKGEESFYKWIQEVCDVPLLLKTYAVNVATGMWDDYWNNTNNFYIYFSTTDKLAYKFYFIPYDYDNTLGTTADCGRQKDAGRQDPFNWGDSSRKLIYRLLKFEDFRALYKQYLLELVSADKALMYYTVSMERIQAWQSQIQEMVWNDTCEDMTITDRPAPWSNHYEYRLLNPGDNNYFRVKQQSIEQYCK